MHKTIFKSQSPINAVRQLVRQNTLTNLFENAIDEMDAIVPEKGHLAELWLRVKEQQRATIEIEKKKSQMEGKQASIEEAKSDVAHEIETIQSIITEFADKTIHAVTDFEHSLVKLSVKIAEKIIKKQIESEDDIVLSVTRSALKTVRKSSEITVLVNPDDFDILTHYEEFNLRENGKVNFTIDETVESGGCKIHSDWGVIDAQIDTQLNEIYTQLISKPDHESPDDSEHVT